MAGNYRHSKKLSLLNSQEKEIKMLPLIRLTGSIFSAAVLLSACGGGGGGAAPPDPSVAVSQVAPGPQVASFSLQSGYKSLIANGQNTQFTISGTCSGTASIVTSPATASTFEGSPALSSTETTTANYTNCALNNMFVPVFSYFDSNYNPLGSAIAGNSFGKYLLPATQFPSSVKVGDTGDLGTETIFADSTKSVFKGQVGRSFIIEKDGVSSSTAIVNLIVKRYDSNNQLVTTTQKRYRVIANGSLTSVSIDVVSTIGGIHLIYSAI